MVLSSKLGKATKEDLDYAIKVVRRSKVETLTLYFPDLWDIKDWKVEA